MKSMGKEYYLFNFSCSSTYIYILFSYIQRVGVLW